MVTAAKIIWPLRRVRVRQRPDGVRPFEASRRGIQKTETDGKTMRTVRMVTVVRTVLAIPDLAHSAIKLL